jgi:D-tyrosyl-tRNA(Tyr) deacylase
VLLQRVASASVRVDDKTVGSIGRGFLILVGISARDGDAEVRWMADKILGLRVFPDGEGRMNRSLADVSGGLLVVSQFTLYGDTSKGRRPSFVDAARPEHAIPIYEKLVGALRESGLHVATGVFGEMMQVELVNDGPVTLWIERDATGSAGA